MSEQEAITAFLRGTTSREEFEQWLYTTSTLEAVLGPEFHLFAISTDFRDPYAIEQLAARLEAWLRIVRAPICICYLWPDSHHFLFGSETYRFIPEEFSVQREQSSWVRAVRCHGCGQPWYTAVDTVDDERYFVRLSEAELNRILEHDQWPTSFNSLENVWFGKGRQSHPEA